MDEREHKRILGQNASLISVTILHYNRGLFSSIAGVQRLGAKSVKRPNVLALSKLGFEFCGHNAEVTSLDFHPVKKEILCSCDALRTIKLWNVNDQTCTGTFKYNEAASSFCWSKDGSQIVSISTKGVRVWLADDGKYFLVRSKNTEMFYSCMFHAIYSQIVILGSDKLSKSGFEFCGHNSENNILSYATMHKPSVNPFLSFSSFVRFDPYSSLNYGIQLTTLAGQFEHMMASYLDWQYNEAASSSCWSKDGSQIISISTKGVRVWSADDGKYFLVRSKNAEMVAKYNCDYALLAIDLLSKLGFEFCGHNAEVTSLDFHPVKKEILCSCDALGTIKLWNVNDQTCTGTFKYNEAASSSCWSKDGSQIISISTKCVRVWSADDGKYFLVRSKNAEIKLGFEFCGHNAEVTLLDFHPVKKEILCSCDALGIIKLWNVNDQTCTTTFKLNKSGFEFCGHNAEFLELWNTTNDLSWTVRAHDGFISSLAGSVTTKMVAKARLDQCVKLWTLEPYQDESEFIGPESVKYKAVPTEKYFWNHQTVAYPMHIREIGDCFAGTVSKEGFVSTVEKHKYKRLAFRVLEVMEFFRNSFNQKKENDGLGDWFTRNLGTVALTGGTTLLVYHLEYARTRLGNDIKISISNRVVTVRQRMMMKSREAIKYKSSIDAFSQILKNEGVKSLYKGASAFVLIQAVVLGFLIVIGNTLSINVSPEKSRSGNQGGHQGSSVSIGKRNWPGQ
ncbi:hypothetical protein JRO89_XS06G0070600 [Xanthoceras sorbifolium]|uniref:Uncharacterized protein n=1 Tax=Xanthoceras sorbifolium TaxID=99658 RepID=A0ABQ8HX18_9ROSI|nr:hypothetical protein JRO89_XS06G0070600 [Xanthoceras sorbifolium]